MDRLIKSQKAVVVGAVILTVAAALAALVLFNKLNAALLWVEHTLLVQNTSKDLLLKLVNAETGQRGFLVSADAKYLEPYEKAIRELRTPWDKLRNLTGDNDTQQGRLAVVEPLISKRLDEMESTIKLARGGQLAEARELVLQNTNKGTMDKIREQLAAVDIEELSLLSSRTAMADELRKWLLAFILLALLGALGLAGSVSKAFRDHFVDLDAAHKNLQTSNLLLESRVAERTAELEASKRNIEHDAHRLRVAEARQRVAVEAGELGTWDLDMTTNRAVRTGRHDQIFGYETPPPEWGTENFLAHVHPDDRARIELLLAEGSRNETSWDFECRILRASDQQSRWIEVHGGPRFDEQGQLAGYVGVVADVTDRKGREEQLEFVTKELAHRSKNMMAVIQAISRQTAKHSSSVETFEKSFSARLAGLSQSQDLLLGKNWRGADLQDLVVAHLTPFTERSRLKIDGPPVILRPESAQNFGFALHELATNAAKYGALSVPPGIVTVSWILEAGRIRFCWQEHGGPAVTEPSRKGFGNFVTGKMMEQTLGGTVAFAYRRRNRQLTVCSRAA